MRERIRALPGMDVLLPALAGLAPAYLVGGAVRDLLRGERAVDLDVAVEGDATAVARDVAERTGGDAVVHDRFGTATVHAPGLAVDLATTRRERYEQPGALPVVEPAPLEEDLARRDFAINAMALALSGDRLGELQDPHGGQADLYAGLVRVLHEGSFVDDPTRLLRAVRYEARLGFRLEAETERLARAGDHLLETVSAHRMRDELMDLLAEVEVARAVHRLWELGIDLRGLRVERPHDAELVASAALACSETGADRALASLAALVSHDPDGLASWVEALGLRRSDANRVLAAARQAAGLVAPLRAELPASAVHALLRCEPPETLALALALGAPARPILGFMADLRDVHLEISGDDLIEAGVERSPAIGRALDEVLRRKLDGELSGREAELAAALEIAKR
jgi:tRNA nucleotidyltransferase (CCA-adding enzyme)